MRLFHLHAENQSMRLFHLHQIMAITRPPNLVDVSVWRLNHVSKEISLSDHWDGIRWRWLLIGQPQPRGQDSALSLHVMGSAAPIPSDAAYPLAKATLASDAKIATLECGHARPFQRADTLKDGCLKACAIASARRMSVHKQQLVHGLPPNVRLPPVPPCEMSANALRVFPRHPIEHHVAMTAWRRRPWYEGRRPWWQWRWPWWQWPWWRRLPRRRWRW